MKLMVCDDGSEFSRAVMPAVQMLAREVTHADVHLVRVVDINKVQSETYGEARVIERDRVIAQQREEMRQELHIAARGLPSEPTCAILFKENVVDALTEYAREHEVDLIAMATHSRSPVGELLAGSTARAILRSGVAPVVLVHPGA